MAINGVIDLLTNGLSKKYDLAELSNIIEQDERKKFNKVVEKIVAKMQVGKFPKAVKFAMEKIEDWEDFSDDLPKIDEETSFLDVVVELSDLYEYAREYKKQLKCKEELNKEFGIDTSVFESVELALESILKDIQLREDQLQVWINARK
jgi:hypothetical protein